MRKTLLPLLLTLASLVSAHQGGARSGQTPQRVRVVGVTDGDTVKVLTADKRQLKVRLNGIDAPESTQPFGQKSERWLSSQVFGKDVDLYSDGTDKYGRTLGTLKIAGKDVNLASVRSGWSWWYRQYAKGRLDLSAAESNARKEKIGLWSQGVAQAPRDYRHGGRPRGDSSSSGSSGSMAQRTRGEGPRTLVPPREAVARSPRWRLRGWEARSSTPPTPASATTRSGAPL